MQAFSAGALRVWRAEVRSDRENGAAIAVALFNLGDAPLVVDQPAAALGLLRASEREARDVTDVWSGKRLGDLRQVHATIPPHGCLLLERR